MILAVLCRMDWRNRQSREARKETQAGFRGWARPCRGEEESTGPESILEVEARLGDEWKEDKTGVTPSMPLGSGPELYGDRKCCLLRQGTLGRQD